MLAQLGSGDANQASQGELNQSYMGCIQVLPTRTQPELHASKKFICKLDPHQDKPNPKFNVAGVTRYGL